MGIREEIEKLYVQHANITTLPSPRGLSYEAILSLLDEHLGECVDDRVIDGFPDIALVDWKNYDVLSSIELNPGDHISIYVRKADEVS